MTAQELNIQSEEILKLESPVFRSVREEPFRIYGLLNPLTEPHFHRLPDDVAHATSEAVYANQLTTAGGRIRFVTDSAYICAKILSPKSRESINMCPIAWGGFDIYVNKNGRDTYAGVLKPPFSYKDSFETNVVWLGGGRKEITINFPNYSAVNEVYLGLDSKASLERRDDYRFERPVLYYGSSITHGGSASRPGLSYENLISRRLDTNYINFGFAGSAKGEDAIADYMASLDYSVFVLDYDHNAPNPEHLAATHERLYKKIRAAHPDIPIIMVGRPDCNPINRDTAKRRDVIYNTYINAKNRGEKVIFIDGYSLFQGELREECTVDGIHPNDLGMVRMADVIGKAVEYALAW